MVKTAAKSVHTCDFDWATETGLVMDSTKTLPFDILRACPVMTPLLDDFKVDEDTGAVSFDLGTYVDDEQDVNADMLWTITGGTIDAYAGILSDFPTTGLTGVKGVQSITPLPDQFGTFELTFEVVDIHGQTVTDTISYTVENINDAPIICDKRTGVDENCDNDKVYIYLDSVGSRNNSRDEGFTSFDNFLGKVANSPAVSFIVDQANEQVPNQQGYTWTAASDCDQLSVNVAPNNNNIPTMTVLENGNWEQGGLCVITLELEDDGLENAQAQPVDVLFEVIPKNDVPAIANSGQVNSLDSTNNFLGEMDGNYRVTLIEDTTDSNALTFDLSGIKSDIDHLPTDLTWGLEDTGCISSNYYTTKFTDAQGQEVANGDYLVFDLIPNAATNAEPWEEDMLQSGGIHQTRTTNGYCDMTLYLNDTLAPPVNMPNNGNGQNYTALSMNSYVPKSTSVTLSVKVDNVAENVPDYYLDATEGFDFNGVNNVMPGTMVPVDFSINAGGDEGPYNYNHLLLVALHSNGHTDNEVPKLYTPPAFGTSLDIDDWEVRITDQTTEVWVEVDVVTCDPGQVCTPESNSIQSDSPESHNAISGQQVGGKWSEPGRIGEATDENDLTTTSDRRPAFEDLNWCNNLMTTNAADTTVAWSDAAQCGHTEKGYRGIFVEDWQTGDNSLPVVVTTIGALSVASFAPSIIAVILTGMFVSALVFAGRREDDEEEFVEETIDDDESAVSPVIATILMVAITVVLSGVVYVWAAQLADTDTKGVPVVTFSADNIATASTDSDHWKITVGTAQTVLATQAVEVTVGYINAAGEAESQTINLASTNHVYGFSPYNSDSLVTFGDVVTIDGDEVISTFSTGDDIYVKTHLADGTPLVDATIRIIYNPPGDAQGATLKEYSKMTWNQPV
jgi:flagellin-like protein